MFILTHPNTHSFGARYYNSDLSIWLSVDPMSDKYPSLSPYVYCANNPVRLVDKDGREIEIKEIVNNTIVDGEPPKQGLNKRVVNFLNNLDIKAQGHFDNSRYEGHSDGALSGQMYKQDYIVGGAMLGLITGLGAMLEGGFTILGLLTTTNSADDLFANSQGESGIQQCFSGHHAKTVIGIGKGALSFSGWGVALRKGIKTKGAFQFFDSGINMFSTGINTFNTIDSFTNENVNKNESTDKKEQKGY